jgi:hypothetical protein
MDPFLSTERTACRRVSMLSACRVGKDRHGAIRRF